MVFKIIDVLWKIYIIIVIALIVSGIIAIYNSSQVLIKPAINIAFTGIYLVGLFGYVYNKAILNRKVWLVLFWVNVAGVLANMYLYISIYPHQRTAGQVISILLSLPIIFALYKYSSKKNPMWPLTQFANKALKLKALFENNTHLTATVINDDEENMLQTDVSLSKNTDSFDVKIERTDMGNSLNEFDDLESAIRFIEGNTVVRVSDFSIKNA